MKKLIYSVLLASLLPLQVTWAGQATLQDIQRQWAIANYQMQGKQQVQAFEKLIQDTEAAVNANPQSAELWIWDGIVKSSFGGVKGGLGGLSYAKQSRQSLERALDIEDTALQGSAYTSLGVLYYKVPGWPLGFGSDKKASKLLMKALEINPEGIDPNYFYGDFLLQNGEYQAAEKYLRKAQAAAPRPGRKFADEGRQQEIKAALAVVEKKK